MQRFLTLGLLLVVFVWTGGFLSAGRPGWAAMGVLLLFGHGFFLAAEFVLLGRIHDPRGTPRATRHELWTAWWGEFTLTPFVFNWRQPFRSNTIADFLPTHPDGRRGVVLIHGFVCNRGFWNPWMKRLGKASIPFIAPNLEPVFTSIDDHAPSIEQAVARLEAATGIPPLLVAHSMGGLAVRHWMQTRAAHHRVHHVITVGTPHEGTWLARLARQRPGTEMALNSRWLQRLRLGHRPGDAASYTCFYGNADNVVFPASSGRLDGADNRLIRSTAHVCLAFHEDVFEEAVVQLTGGGSHPNARSA